MILYVPSVQLSLLACLLATVSCVRNTRRKNRDLKPDDRTPQCLYSDLVYNATLDKCLQKGTEVQCGQNMHFDFLAPGGGGGACVCRIAIDKPCSGRPQIPSEDNDRCWNLGQRGPCPRGQVLVPNDEGAVLCGIDACKNKKPRNARKLSLWAESDPNIKALRFKFTHNGECYKSETEAFCGEGKVVRFRFPSTIPLCVENQPCSSTANILRHVSRSVLLRCDGIVDRTSKQCRMKQDINFDE